MTKPKIHTAIRAHIEALYSEHGQLDSFVLVREPGRDEGEVSEQEEVKAEERSK